MKNKPRPKPLAKQIAFVRDFFGMDKPGFKEEQKEIKKALKKAKRI